MKQLISIIYTAILLSSPTLSYGKDNKGFFVGGALLSSSLDDGSYSSNISNLHTKNTNSTGNKIYFGYMFNKIVGLEACYTNTGNFSYINTNNQDVIHLKPTITSIGANLGYSFSNGIRAFSVVGLGYLELNQSNSSLYSNDKGTVLHVSFGIQWTPKQMDGIGFRAGIDNDIFVVKQYYYYGGSTYQGNTYTNNIRNLYLGVNYNF